MSAIWIQAIQSELTTLLQEFGEMVRPRNFVLAAVATTVMSLVSPVFAGVVFDNLSVTPSTVSTNPDPLSGDGPQFASFSTGSASSGLTLSDVKLILAGDNTSTNSFTVSLVSDGPLVGGNPGPDITNPVLATLGTFSDSTLSSTATVYDIPGLSIVFAANTRYWIELSGSTSTVGWGFASDASGTGVSTEYDAFYNGGSYAGQSHLKPPHFSNGSFRINGY